MKGESRRCKTKISSLKRLTPVSFSGLFFAPLVQKGVTMVTHQYRTLAELILSKPGVSGSPADIEAFVDKQIATRTARLKPLMGLRKMSRDDIRQEFLLAILGAMSRFDSTKASWRTYVSRVCNYRYCELQREYSTDVNGLGNIAPLDTIDEDESDVVPTYETDFETQVDVNTVMSKLSSHLHQIAELLKTNSPSQTAAHLGVSRPTISRAIKQIREYFLTFGFEKFNQYVTK